MHYSLGGIHCVAGNPFRDYAGIVFPSELGRVLVQTLQLVRTGSVRENGTLDDTISVFENHELARATLLALHRAIQEGVEPPITQTAEGLATLLQRGRRKKQNWMRFLRVAVQTGGAAAILPLGPGVGFLTSLGINIAGEKPSDGISKLTAPVLRTATHSWPTHLTLLLALDECAAALRAGKN